MNFLAFPQSAALWSVLLLLLTIPPATAQSLPSLPIQFNPDNLINPGRPGNRRRGGGSRGGCQAEIPLTAISYADSRTVEELGVTRIEETVGTLTTKAQPTLLFYLPQPLSENTTTELIVQDQHRQLLFQGQLMGQTEHSGVVSVPITVDLALNTPYYWALTLNCTDGSTAVDGWIERRANAPALTRTFNETNPRNRAALYASYGFCRICSVS
ncbi:MAG: DUF928 domain-containing protein [Phormidesmis sp. RL_2_1]|nr:DUF928 domain-containing protein [Phormidesmis sp. RL_2_1]